MDFGLLPPEVNSARMYAGPGPGSLLTAASAWDGIAGELGSVAGCYESVIAELTAEWTGPSAGTMAASATRYVTWMQSTAVAAEQTAGQLRGAVAAYESAFATTVPPPAIAANRSQLQTLVAGNLFGQNTPAIAATEAAYGAMWAQDTTAMYGYAAAAAATTTLTPFAPPPQTSNPAGSTNQAGAAGQAAGNSAASQVQQALSGAPSALQNMTAPNPAAAGESWSVLGALFDGIPLAGTDPAMAAAYASLGASLFGALVIDSAGSFGVDSAGSFGIDFIGLDVAAILAGGTGLTNSMPSLLPAAGLAPVAAAVGHAAPLGGLSVPPAWTAKAPPPIQFVSASTALSGAEAAPDVAADESGISYGEMATAGLAARAIAGVGLGRRGRGGPPGRQGAQLAAQTGSITRIAPELRELANLRDAGILTDEEFSEHKRLLLGH